MARYIRNTAILAKIESVEGTDATPTGGSNAMLISNLSVNPLAASNVDRQLVRNYFGASEQLVGTAYVTADFEVELAGSGTAGTAPAWAPLVVACGWVESGLVTYAAYAPDTPGNQKSCTIYYYDDGVLHKLLGAKGTFDIDMGIGNRPVLKFKFIGKDGGISAASVPSTTLTGWKAPLVITDPNTSDVTLGCTYATGAISGGTTYTTRGLSITAGNSVQYTALLGGDYVDITDRAVTGKIELNLTAAQEVTFMSNVKSNTLQSVGLVHGTATGYIVGVFMTAVQLINPAKAEVNGRRMVAYDMRSVPSAGADDLIIFSK